MKSKSFIFLFVLVFMIVLSLSAVSADDFQTTDSGQVSGDVNVATVNPWDTTGELTYDIPADAKDIKSADVYVNVYAGSAKNTYGANANVSLKTVNGENQIASEELWIENGTSDGTVYWVNDHTDKCYSDYQMRYDITDSLKGLNGSSITLKVDTFEMENKTFDGRIKLIALVLAYDDGDDDTISYWIDSDQKWTKTNVTTIFDTDKVFDITNAELTNVVLSSGDGNYTLNDNLLTNPINHTSGNYYQYNCWNVTDSMKDETETEMVTKYAGTSAYGSIKNTLAVLKVQSKVVTVDMSIATEYTSVPTCYAGTNNTLTIKAKATKAGKYLFEILYDNGGYLSTEVELDGENETSFQLIDPIIRPIDETTVNGANNTMVTYTVVASLNDSVVSTADLTVPVLYNGNLGYDYEYGIKGFESYGSLRITGDAVIDVQDVSTYLGASAMNRTDVWTVNLADGCEIEDAYLFIPYNWFNAKLYNETEDMFNLTFNGQTIEPVAFYRDQGNLGGYGKYGYGVLVYWVDELINTTGDNTLVLNKMYPTPAVYPSALVYFYNNPKGSIKDVSIVLGADLLANTSNIANRVVKSDSVIDMGNVTYENATLYVLAASAQKGEGNIIVNGKVFEDVWSGTSSTTDLFTADITDVLAQSNNISFVATEKTILALPQIIVADTGIVMTVDSIKTEYTSVPTCYAGTENALTVTVTNNKEGNFTIYLLADITKVDEITVNLTNGTHTFVMIDDTIRPVDESTVNGANNKNVTYSAIIMYEGYYAFNQIKVPILYNGYLGKAMYNQTYIEDYNVYAVNGGVEVQTQDVSTYMSASALNRTDIFTIDLDNASSVEKAFIYLAYNWDKSGAAGPVFNVTFNGNAIAPKSTYRDQGNLGKYGSYGYGLFVYDITEFAQAGNNTLFIAKDAGLTAVYPSNLIYLYNTEGSKVLTTVYMANGADLLSNDYNKAGRIVTTGADIADITLGVNNASLYVFAASAQKGEGNIVFNGIVDEDVWDGTSNSLETYVTDINGNLQVLNDIEFVATGSTILALNQMIVTQSVIKVLPEVIIEVPSDVKAGDNVTVNITIPEATGMIYVMADEEPFEIPLDEGSASIIMTNVTEGLHGVGVMYLGDDAYLPGIGLKFFEAGALPVLLGSQFADIVVNDDSTVSLVLKDEFGIPIANATIAYTSNGTVNATTTALDGSFVVPVEADVPVIIAYAGDALHLGAATTVTLKAPVTPVVKVESQFDIANRSITLNGYAVDTKAGEEGIYYATSLLDDKGNPIANAYIEFAVNNKIYNRTTYENGSFAPYKLNMIRAGRYTMAFNFAGDDNYTNAFATVCVDLDKKPIKIKASDKSFKKSTKTKKYTVTLSTIVGSSHDGKAHLRSGLKVTLTVNGKTFTGKTSSSGKVTFKITNLKKKANYKAKISYEGDMTYESASKTVTIKVK